MPVLVARLLGPDGARRLAGVVAVASASAAGAHALDAGLPFPLLERWFVAASLVAAGLWLLPLGPTLRRVGALLIVACLLRGGLPAAHNATFPWIELGRARLAEWEDLAILGACAALSVTAVGVGAAERWSGRLLSLLAAAALGVTLLLPVKASFQVLSAPRPGMVTLPVLGWDAPAQKRWTRVNTEGNALLFLPALVRDEWALLELAGGIHQEAGRAALAKGEGSAVVVRVHEGVRWGLIRALEGVVALTLVCRAAAVPAALLLFGARLTRPLPSWLARLVTVVLRGAVWPVPLANLAALVVATLVWLPDDLALRVPALLSGLGTVALLGLVERCAVGAVDARAGDASRVQEAA